MEETEGSKWFTTSCEVILMIDTGKLDTVRLPGSLEMLISQLRAIGYDDFDIIIIMCHPPNNQYCAASE